MVLGKVTYWSALEKTVGDGDSQTNRTVFYRHLQLLAHADDAQITARRMVLQINQGKQNTCLQFTTQRTVEI
jgi:hypothetical protein